jgi:hypothetical protein
MNAAAVCHEATRAFAAVAQPHSLARAYARFLMRWPWSDFLTITYRPGEAPKDVGRVWRDFRYFTNNLNCDLYGRNWSRRAEGVLYAAAVERHQSGEPHLHAMLGTPGARFGAEERQQWKAWLERRFGRTDFQAVKWDERVAQYILKTAATTNEIELSPTLTTAHRRC